MTRNYGKQLDPAAAAIRDLQVLRPYSREPVSADDLNNNRHEARPDMHFESKSLSQSFSSSMRRTTRKSFGWSQLVREIADKQNQKPAVPQPNMIEQPKNAKLHLVELNSSSLHHKTPAATSTVASRSAENAKNLPNGLSVVECPIGHKRLVGGAFRSSQQLVRCRHCEYLATIKRTNEDEQPESNEENGAAEDASAQSAQSKNRTSQSALSRARHNILELVLPELSSKGVKTASQTARSKSIMQRIVLRPPGKSEADDCPSDQKPQSLASQQNDASLEGVIKSQSLVGSATKVLRESNSRKTVVSTVRSPQARSNRSSHNNAHDISNEVGAQVLEAPRSANDNAVRYTPRNPYSKPLDAPSSSRSRPDANDHAEYADCAPIYHTDRVVTGRRCVPIILPVREDTHEVDETRPHHDTREHTQVREHQEELQPQAEADAEDYAHQDVLPQDDTHACTCEDPTDEDGTVPSCHQYSPHSESNDSLEDELRAAARAASVAYKNPFENMPVRMFTRLQDLRKMEAETIKLEEQNLWTLRQILKKKKKRK